MEFDGLIAHNIPQAIHELRSVKSDSINMKSDLIYQMIDKGRYDIASTTNKSYTKAIIESLITFLNN
jgi:hypothetical protein